MVRDSSEHSQRLDAVAIYPSNGGWVYGFYGIGVRQHILLGIHWRGRRPVAFVGVPINVHKTPPGRPRRSHWATVIADHDCRRLCHVVRCRPGWQHFARCHSWRGDSRRRSRGRCGQGLADSERDGAVDGSRANGKGRHRKRAKGEHDHAVGAAVVLNMVDGLHAAPSSAAGSPLPVPPTALHVHKQLLLSSYCAHMIISFCRYGHTL